MEKISSREIKPLQILGLIFSTITMIMLSFFVILSFDKNSLIVWLLGLSVSLLIILVNSKAVNLTYENRFLFLSNLFFTKKISIDLFMDIERISINGIYTIKFINGEKYYFGIDSVDEFMLVLKKDKQVYAQRIKLKLLEFQRDSVSNKTI